VVHKGAQCHQTGADGRQDAHQIRVSADIAVIFLGNAMYYVLFTPLPKKRQKNAINPDLGNSDISKNCKALFTLIFGDLFWCFRTPLPRNAEKCK
jgi:hypothetical protein